MARWADAAIGAQAVEAVAVPTHPWHRTLIDVCGKQTTVVPLVPQGNHKLFQESQGPAPVPLLPCQHWDTLPAVTSCCLPSPQVPCWQYPGSGCCSTSCSPGGTQSPPPVQGLASVPLCLQREDGMLVGAGGLQRWGKALGRPRGWGDEVGGP